jgi:hypothetical protein
MIIDRQMQVENVGIVVVMSIAHKSQQSRRLVIIGILAWPLAVNIMEVYVYMI